MKQLCPLLLAREYGGTIEWTANVRDGLSCLPKRKSQVFEIKPVGHRRLLNFVDRDTGMRSVLLDQLLKVEQ